MPKPRPYEGSLRARRVVSAVAGFADEFAQLREGFMDVLRQYHALAEETNRLREGKKRLLDACEEAAAIIGGWHAGATEADVKRVLGTLNLAIATVTDGRD